MRADLGITITLRNAMICLLGLLAHFIITTVNNTNTNSSSPSNSTRRLLVEVDTLGYNGTWEQFCDPEEMEKDYCSYPKHELRKLRTLLCHLHKADKMDRKALLALAVYKYCVVMRPRIDDFLIALTRNLAGNDPEKRRLLLAQGPMNENSTCYETCLSKFSEMCVEEKNPYFRMFKPLIASACEMYWLSAEDIKDHIERVCAHRLVVADISWEPVLETISYTEE